MKRYPYCNDVHVIKQKRTNTKNKNSYKIIAINQEYMFN